MHYVTLKKQPDRLKLIETQLRLNAVAVAVVFGVSNALLFIFFDPVDLHFNGEMN